LNNFDLNNKKVVPFNDKEELTINNYKDYLKKKYFVYEKYFKPNALLKDNKRVIKNKFTLEHGRIPDKYNFYIIPNQQFNFEVEKRKKSVGMKNTNIIKQKSLFGKNELSQEVKDNIKENIVDVLTKVFKNEEISDTKESIKVLMDSLSTDYGRELYTNILYENSNISNENSFQFLSEIIFESVDKIINMGQNKKNLIYCVKLVKSCHHFRKVENKKDIYLCDTLYPKFQKFPLISEKKFWKEWANLDLNEENNENNGNEDKNKKSVKSLENIMCSMSKIGFNKTLIYSTIVEIAKENITEEPVFLNFMKKVVEYLKIMNL
jgi:hypothetical protein